MIYTNCCDGNVMNKLNGSSAELVCSRCKGSVNKNGHALVHCSNCNQIAQTSQCSRCEGEGGSRSGSDDDGNAWSDCEYCYGGVNYECHSEDCQVHAINIDGSEVI